MSASTCPGQYQGSGGMQSKPAHMLACQPFYQATIIYKQALKNCKTAFYSLVLAVFAAMGLPWAVF